MSSQSRVGTWPVVEWDLSLVCWRADASSSPAAQWAHLQKCTRSCVGGSTQKQSPALTCSAEQAHEAGDTSRKSQAIQALRGLVFCRKRETAREQMCSLSGRDEHKEQSWKAKAPPMKREGEGTSQLCVANRDQSRTGLLIQGFYPKYNRRPPEGFSKGRKSFSNYTGVVSLKTLAPLDRLQSDAVHSTTCRQAAHSITICSDDRLLLHLFLCVLESICTCKHMHAHFFLSQLRVFTSVGYGGTHL